jgi:hypothetical protein
VSPAEALAAMRAKGVVLFLGESVDDDRVVLRWRAGPNIVTPKTISYIARHQQDIIALLAAEAEADRLRLEAAMATFDLEAIGAR